MDQELGNLEGKELRFGTSAGATFAAVTTAATCGSVNCMHDSLNPLAGLSPFTGLWINCVFGGKGVGLINMLIYIIIAVFLAGLMVGRTPEYLGKKVEAREMKLAVLALLVHPVLILAATGLFAAARLGRPSRPAIPGPHGLSQILYEFSSASANNGSGFEGLRHTWGFNQPEDNLTPPPPTARTGTSPPAWSCCSADSCRSSPRSLSRPASAPRSRRLSRSALSAPTRSRLGSFCWEPSFWSVRCCFMPAAMLGPGRGAPGTDSLWSADPSSLTTIRL